MWVKLRNLPFSFWSAQAIGKVASAVGKPLYVDHRIEQMDMLTFARVCVEITADQPSCDSILLVHNGNSRIVDVEYEWRPQVCSKCGIFGHNCNPSAPRQASNLRRPAAKAPVSVVPAPVQLPQDRPASPVSLASPV